MKFKVIKVSEANVDWNNQDKEYFGPIPGFVAGFNFEVIDKNGKIDYMSAYYMHEDPNDFISNLFYDYFEIVRWNGYEPTGRVVFRGYAKEYYDYEEREEYVIDAHDEAIASLK